MTPLERKEYAKGIFVKHPDSFPDDHRSAILEGRVLLGMPPFSARLAGGAFAFKVTADQKWPKNASPYDVMWAQTAEPDNSQIWMTFENDSQFPELGKVRFSVYFSLGQAREITLEK